jgi:transposase
LGLADEVTALRALVAQQVAVIEALRVQVAELQRQLAANSRNSSRPPSSDGLAKPPPRSQRKAVGRRPGKQPGAPGAGLAQVAEPAAVVIHRPSWCVGCRADLAGVAVLAVESRQVFDVPAPRLVVTEHRVVSCRCVCGVISTAGPADGVPTEAVTAVQYGPRLAAMAVYLLVGQHLPVARTGQVLADLCGAAVSTGWLASLTGRGAARLRTPGGFGDRLRALVLAAAVVHFDETGLRVGGRLRWLHVACTPLGTIYHLDDRRGTTAIDALGILEQMRAPQVAVHDGWKPYLQPSYRQVPHALCNAHHLRELIGWAEHDPARNDWAHSMIEILVDGQRAVAAALAAGRDRLDPPVLARLLTRWDAAVQAGHQAYPRPVKGARGPVLALIDRMRDYKAEIWRFAHQLWIPFDNNQAERDIRMTKTQQKISGGWRTTTGAHDWLTIRSYVSTAAKHGQNLLTALHDLITGHPWLPALPE